MRRLETDQLPSTALRKVRHDEGNSLRTRLSQTRSRAAPTGSRLLLIDALRAVSVTIITWHHFALYWPFSEAFRSVFEELIFGFKHYARATQVFFVIGGFVMARSLSPRLWDGKRFGWFIVSRYCRLGLPYLAAIALALAACAWGRGWLPESVIGPPPTWGQILSHTVFLEYILGYEGLSAGLWFVCINFQLGLIFVGMLYLRDVAVRRGLYFTQSKSEALPLALGWMLALASLFYFNLDERWEMWAIYFFGHFFLGVLAYHATKNRRGEILFGAYCLMILAALVFQWRWRLAISLVTSSILFFGGKFGMMAHWPRSRMVSYMGRSSYSLFLVHFPVLVVVAALWERFEWVSPWQTVLGLSIAYIVSLATAAAFYHFIESRIARLSPKP